MQKFKRNVDSLDTCEIPKEREAQAHQQINASKKKGTAPKKKIMTTKLRKTFSLSMYKYHAMGDYPAMIHAFGTTDSYSMQSVSCTTLLSYIIYTDRWPRESLNIGGSSDSMGTQIKTKPSPSKSLFMYNDKNSCGRCNTRLSLLTQDMKTGQWWPSPFGHWGMIWGHTECTKYHCYMMIRPPNQTPTLASPVPCNHPSHPIFRYPPLFGLGNMNLPCTSTTDPLFIVQEHPFPHPHAFFPISSPTDQPPCWWLVRNLPHEGLKPKHRAQLAYISQSMSRSKTQHRGKNQRLREKRAENSVYKACHKGYVSKRK